jgi:hypothetical protein
MANMKHNHTARTPVIVKRVINQQSQLKPPDPVIQIQVVTKEPSNEDLEVIRKTEHAKYILELDKIKERRCQINENTLETLRKSVFEMEEDRIVLLEKYNNEMAKTSQLEQEVYTLKETIVQKDKKISEMSKDLDDITNQISELEMKLSVMKLPQLVKPAIPRPASRPVHLPVIPRPAPIQPRLAPMPRPAIGISPPKLSLQQNPAVRRIKSAVNQPVQIPKIQINGK